MRFRTAPENVKSFICFPPVCLLSYILVFRAILLCVDSFSWVHYPTFVASWTRASGKSNHMSFPTTFAVSFEMCPNSIFLHVTFKNSFWELFEQMRGGKGCFSNQQSNHTLTPGNVTLNCWVAYSRETFSN